MTQSTARRRGHGEDAIYFDAAKNRYVGAVSLGFGPDGKHELKALHPNSTVACAPQLPTRCRKRWMTGLRAACRDGRSAPGPCSGRP